MSFPTLEVRKHVPTVLTRLLEEDVSDWEQVHNIIVNSSQNDLTHYHLYLILSQKQIPASPNVLKAILEANPVLCNQSNRTYELNMIIAFKNPDSRLDTLHLLLNFAEQPIDLVYKIIKYVIHKGDIIPRTAIEVLMHRNYADALYYQDSKGNLPLHLACITCRSPMIVELIIERMIRDFGWGCVVCYNNEGQSPFHLALTCEAFLTANAVLVKLLQAIPMLVLPTKDCLMRHDILHTAIRVENVFMAFKILEKYPELINVWSSHGTLPLHDICQFGSSVSLQIFLETFIVPICAQITACMMSWTKFIPIQIAAINPSTSVAVMKILLRLHHLKVGFGSIATVTNLDPAFVVHIVRQYGLLHLSATASNINVTRYLMSLAPEAISTRKFKHFGATWEKNAGPLPLFFACVTGSSEMVQFLFEEGLRCGKHSFGGLIDVDSGNELHPIVAACGNHNMSSSMMIKLLEESNFPVDLIQKLRLLHCASFEGNIEAAIGLIDYYPDLIYIRDEDGNLPLHDACAGSNPDMVEFLFLKSCNDTYVENRLDKTPLRMGGMFHRNEIGIDPWDMLCEMLECMFIDLEDDMNHLRPHHNTLMSVFVVALIFDSILKYQHDTGMAHQIRDVEFDEFFKVKLPFTVNHSAITLIHNVSLLEYVLPENYYSCDPLAVDSSGRTALHLAVEKQQQHEDWSSIIDYLLHDEENGSKKCASIQDKKSQRFILHSAAANGLEWYKGLQYIADANVVAEECKDEVTGLYPFMLAAAGENSDLCSIFELLRRNPWICL